ncbi:MAG: hypothetical protein PHC34_13235 [Candidatus Gastranaerophilales bacterium]|nr:hypothetical protein [Candidatus Gastranaerophilales bacterium]
MSFYRLIISIFKKNIPTSEGYVSVTGTNYNYVFNYTDHLGNIRLSYTKDPTTGVLKILEQSHYYPYGMKHSNYNDSKHDYDQGEGGIFAIIKPVIRSNYQYKYNGQEYQDELGLNLYDMDFRDYDPAIGRWTGIDPVVHYSQSTYNAFDGNPVFWADPSGADATTYVRGSDGEWKQSSVQSDEEFKDDLRRFGLPDYLNYLSQGNVDGGSGFNDAIYRIQQQALGNATIYVTDEIVGKQTIRDYPSDKGGRYKTPLYKVIVSGTDANGNVISKSFKAIRFGIKTNADGPKSVVFLAAGSYSLKDFHSSYYGNTGAFRITGKYLIHMNSLNSADGNNGCIAIAGGRTMWNEFKSFVSQLTFNSDLSNAAQSGNIILNIQYSSTPKLF